MTGRKMESFALKSIRIAAIVSLYWFVSISMVFVNKYLLSSDELKLNAPLFVTWFQCVVTVLCCVLLSVVAKLFPNTHFPKLKVEPKTCRTTLPLSVIFVSMITFNNLCLMHVGIAFYYIGRSLTTVFNMVMSYLLLKQTTSCKAIICCGIIIFGFFFGVNQEGLAGSLSLIGVIFGAMASASVALNAIFTKKILPLVDNNVWKLTLHNNINATILFIPLMIIFGELNVVMTFPKLGNLYFWYLMSLSGLFGFGIGFLTGLQIQFTSPLTHNISGTAKACAQTVIACVYNHEVKAILWWLSNVIVLLGSAGYTEVKRQEMKKEHDSYSKEEVDLSVETGDMNEKLLPGS